MALARFIAQGDGEEALVVVGDAVQCSSHSAVSRAMSATSTPAIAPTRSVSVPST